MLELDFHPRFIAVWLGRAVIPVIFTCAWSSLGSSRIYQLSRICVHLCVSRVYLETEILLRAESMLSWDKEYCVRAMLSWLAMILILDFSEKLVINVDFIIQRIRCNQVISLRKNFIKNNLILYLWISFDSVIAHQLFGDYLSILN